MIGFILIAIGIACVIISFVVPNMDKKQANRTYNSKEILDFLYNNNMIDEEQFINAQYMQQQEFQNFINQQIQIMDQNHQDLFMQQMHLNQMEMDRMMSTGIEFGGINPDLNLNPTMLNEHMNQMNQMQNDAMNNFNNMNNNNMNNGGMF